MKLKNTEEKLNNFWPICPFYKNTKIPEDKRFSGVNG